MEFDLLVKTHNDHPPEIFNSDDEKYKSIIIEAIDGKAHAKQKMNIWLEAVLAGSQQDHCNQIFHAPITDFACPGKKLELQTGIVDFPWKQVVVEKSADINLGDWNAAEISESKLDFVVSALASNLNTRFFFVKGVKLCLEQGWETCKVDWSNKEVLSELPATVSILLRGCTRLTELNLRSAVHISISVAAAEEEEAKKKYYD